MLYQHKVNQWLIVSTTKQACYSAVLGIVISLLPISSTLYNTYSDELGISSVGSCSKYNNQYMTVKISTLTCWNIENHTTNSSCSNTMPYSPCFMITLLPYHLSSHTGITWRLCCWSQEYCICFQLSVIQPQWKIFVTDVYVIYNTDSVKTSAPTLHLSTVSYTLAAPMYSLCLNTLCASSGTMLSCACRLFSCLK